MRPPAPVGHDIVTDRELYALEAPAVEAVTPGFRLPTSRWVALVCLDARHATDAALHRLAAALLEAGAVALACWGPGCPRLHRVFVDAALVAEPSQDDAWQILTACHASASLDEALAHLLRGAQPADAYREDCRAAVALVVGLPAIATHVRDALAEPGDFLRRA